MSDRATPETDDHILDHNAPIWLCRKLERERDEARELARELRDALEKIAQEAGKQWQATEPLPDIATIEKIATGACDKAGDVLP